jgi:hypothetical protein
MDTRDSSGADVGHFLQIKFFNLPYSELHPVKLLGLILMISSDYPGNRRVDNVNGTKTGYLFSFVMPHLT